MKNGVPRVKEKIFRMKEGLYSCRLPCFNKAVLDPSPDTQENIEMSEMASVPEVISPVGESQGEHRDGIST